MREGDLGVEASFGRRRKSSVERLVGADVSLGIEW